MNEHLPQQNQQFVSEKPGAIAPWLLIVFIIVLFVGGGYIGWYFYSQSKTTTSTSDLVAITPVASSSVTALVAPTSATTDLIYTNSTYGFTMTFPASWKGYKMKEVTMDGAAKVYYCNFPTTDATVMADESADAGYFSPFAIGVYTLSQWADIEAAEGPKPSVLAKNDTYVFTASQANGISPADFVERGDIEGIFDSFTLK